MLPHGLPWGKNGGTLSDVSSLGMAQFLSDLSPGLRRLVYTYQFLRLFTFLYQDQQVVLRHRGKLRCTLAARRASPLQSVPNKSCEWNAGIPIKLTAKGTENQWVGKWICVRGPADLQRLCWLPSSLKQKKKYIYIYNVTTLSHCPSTAAGASKLHGPSSIDSLVMKVCFTLSGWRIFHKMEEV